MVEGQPSAKRARRLARRVLDHMMDSDFGGKSVRSLRVGRNVYESIMMMMGEDFTYRPPRLEDLRLMGLVFVLDPDLEPDIFCFCS